MEHNWYFPKGNESGGESEDGRSEFMTETITVTEEQTYAEWKTSRLIPSELAYEINAYKEENGVKEEVRIVSSASVSDTTTYISMNWSVPFKGYIEISTWKK